MIPPPDIMLATALELESAAHGEGWDVLPPTVGCVALDDGVPFVFPLSVQPSRLSDNLPDGFALAVKELRLSKSFGSGLPVTEDLCGLWLATEAWAHSDTTVERSRLADTPGAMECRQILLLDFAGLLHFVIRVRGGGPEAMTCTYDDVAPAVDMAVVVGLRDLALEHALWLPDAAVDIIAVSRWTTPLTA